MLWVGLEGGVVCGDVYRRGRAAYSKKGTSWRLFTSLELPQPRLGRPSDLWEERIACCFADWVDCAGGEGYGGWAEHYLAMRCGPRTGEVTGNGLEVPGMGGPNGYAGEVEQD